MLSDAHQRVCEAVNETKVSTLRLSLSLREGYKCQDPGTHDEKDLESFQAHTGCRVCSWRVSFRLGLGGEAELPLCRSWVGLAWSGYIYM